MSVKLAYAQAATPHSVSETEAPAQTILCSHTKDGPISNDTKELLTETRNIDEHSLTCTDHGYQAAFHCERCDIPVCVKCVTGIHQCHKMVDLSEILQREKELLQNDINRIENDILPSLMERREELDLNNKRIGTNMQQIAKDMEYEIHSFQTEIERVHNERIKNLNSIRDSQSAIFDGRSKEIEMKISLYKGKILEYRDAIETESLSKIISITKIKESPLNSGSKPKLQEPPVFIPGNICFVKENLGQLHDPCVSNAGEEVEKLHFLSLSCAKESLGKSQISSVSSARENQGKSHVHFLSSTRTEFKSKELSYRPIISFSLICALLAAVLAYGVSNYSRPPEENSVILTTPIIQSKFVPPLKSWTSLFITKEGDVWLGAAESSELIMVDIKGQILRRRKIKVEPWALAVMDNGDIIVSPSTFSSSVIRLLKDDREKVLHISDGNSYGVSVTANQEILICTIDGRVLIANGDGSNVRQIYKGSGDDSVTHAIENTDGNIYISDMEKSAVVIVSKDGHVLSSLTHTTKGQKLGRPIGLVVDKMGNVLCADTFNNVIYIIDQNKHIRELVELKDSIIFPCFLAVDSNHYLWITQRDGTVHVVKYLSQ
ncbi:hypothetical protein FSP39_016175 [Pinctada imbricata]|uniref:B box-type domain-containing protein n=1 Tax=Pinctada imbricata TaxID=66713 RepID=A0AA89CE22_PINIB|nr:hypothetical protein FSP39_016175 [Pinctada imbricata]